MGDAIQAQLTTADRVRAKLDFDDIVEVKAVGAETPRDFKVCFENHVDADRLGVIQQCFKLEQIDDKCVVIRVPDEWVLVAAPADEPESTPELTETEEAKIFVRETLKGLGFNMAGAVVSDNHTGNGGAPNRYAVDFPKGDRIAVKTDKEIMAQSIFTNSWRSGSRLVVTLPDNWKTQATEAVADPELTETARLIKELQERLAEKDSTIEAKDATIDFLQSQINGMYEQRYAKFDSQTVEHPAGALTTSTCKEVNIKPNINEIDLQKYLNDRWEVLHIQFEGSKLNVVFVHDTPDTPSPTPLHAAVKLDQHIYNPARQSWPERRDQYNQELQEVGAATRNRFAHLIPTPKPLPGANS